MKDQTGSTLRSKKEAGNILLSTNGTVGDIIPFLRLGRALQLRGHQVTLLTHCAYETEAQKAGLAFAAIDTPQEFQQFIQDGPLLNNSPTIPVFLRRHILPKIVSIYELIRERRHRRTVLVTRSMPGVAERLAAEKLEIPLVSMLMSPSHITSIPLVGRLIGSVFGAEISQLRLEMGLQPIHDWWSWWRSVQRSIGLWPEWFDPPQANWPPGVKLAGFLWRDKVVTTEMPEAVREMLDDDEPPIFITGGTGMVAGREFFAASVQACRLLGCRGIVVTRHKGLLPSYLPAEVKWFEYLPSLEAPLPHVGAVIHHGGMGTLEQAFCAGVPQLALAEGGDRPDNAIHLQNLGVGEFLPQSQWQPELIAQALRRLASSAAVKARCQELAHRLQDSDAASIVCEVIEDLIWDNHLLQKPASISSSAHNDVSGQRKEKEESMNALLTQVSDLSPKRRALLMLQLEKSKEIKNS